MFAKPRMIDGGGMGMGLAFAPPVSQQEMIGWHHLLIGGGGYMTGMEVAADGSMVARADVAGAYHRAGDTGEWRQLFTYYTLPAGATGRDANGDLLIFNASFGCYDIRIAPSDTDIFYALYDRKLYKTTDRVATPWVETSWANEDFDPNNQAGGYRTHGPHIAIKPDDSDVVIVCAPTSLQRTANGGMSFSALPGVSTPTTDAGGIAVFDPITPTICYVHSYGNGTYRSTDSGATWSLLSSGPTTARKMDVGDDHVLMVLDDSGGNDNIWIWDGSWTHRTASTGNPWSAIAPVRDAVGGKWYVASESHAEVWYTTNNGSTFPAVLTCSLSATDVPWLAATNETFQSGGAVVWHNGTLWGSEGIGIWRIDSVPTTTSNPAWVSNTAGIEIMIAVDVIFPPGGSPVAAMWDRPFMKLAFGDTYPSGHGPDYSHGIRLASCLDWASDDPSIVIGLMVEYEQKFCISNNYGATGSWTEKAMPSGWDGWGSCAAADATHMIMVGTGNAQRMKWSDDAGNTWNNATMPGVPTTGDTGMGQAIRESRKNVAADRVNIGTFYHYNTGRSADASFAGIWKSTDGGANWTNILVGAIAFGGGAAYDVAQYSLQLKCAPGNAGHMFITAGNNSGTGSLVGKFFRIIDDGSPVLEEVPNVIKVFAFDYGAPKPGGSGYPSLYVTGYVNGVYGTHRCDNADEADPADFVWTQVGEAWPLGWVGWARCMAADPSVWNKPILGYSDQGYFYHQPA